jgi:putative membrane protein
MSKGGFLLTPRNRKRPTLNNGSFIQSVLILCFIILLAWLDITRQLPLYINPKFIVLTELSYFLLIPMFIIQVFDPLLPARNIDEHCHTHTTIWKYVPFFAILLLAFAVPENTLNANLVSSKGLNSQSSVTASSIQDLPRPLASAFSKMPTIKITNLNYTEAVCEINNFPQDYIGKKVTMTGFVFRSPELASNQISLVRYVVMCCTADSLPYGIMSEGTDTKNYPDGTWLTIEGVVQMSKYDDKDAPTIKITSLQKIEEPQEPYVFPYN